MRCLLNEINEFGFFFEKQHYKASAFTVNEEIPLWDSTQPGITERLEVVLPALEG